MQGGMETDTPSMAAALLWVPNTVGCRVGSGNLQTTKQYKQNTQRASAPPRAGAALSAYTAGSSRTVSVARGCGMGEVAHPHTQQHNLTAHPLLFSAKPIAEPPTTHPIGAGSAVTLLETFAPKAPLSLLTSAPVLTTAAGNAQWPFAAPPPWGQSCHWEAVAWRHSTAGLKGRSKNITEQKKLDGAKVPSSQGRLQMDCNYWVENNRFLGRFPNKVPLNLVWRISLFLFSLFLCLFVFPFFERERQKIPTTQPTLSMPISILANSIPSSSAHAGGGGITRVGLCHGTGGDSTILHIGAGGPQGLSCHKGGFHALCFSGVLIDKSGHQHF